MKKLINQALSEAIIKLEKRIPNTHNVVKSSECIMDVDPLKMAEFMKENNIPEDATFDGIPNGYDGWEGFCLSWTVEEPVSDKHKEKERRRMFSTIAHQELYHLLIANNYRRHGFNSGLLKNFDDTTVYDMFINKDFDRLVEYYSMSFTKID